MGAPFLTHPTGGVVKQKVRVKTLGPRVDIALHFLSQRVKNGCVGVLVFLDKRCDLCVKQFEQRDQFVFGVLHGSPLLESDRSIIQTLEKNATM